MFQTGDRVMYGIHGVCDVIGTETQVQDRQERMYLVLEPLAQPGSRYLIPTHNSTAMGKMKRMMTSGELEELLSSEDIRKNEWIPDESTRKQLYRTLISGGDRKKLMSMIHTLYQHKVRQTSAGRKMHLCDENFLRDAEKLLAGEIAFVLDMPQEQAIVFLRNRLQ